MSFRAYPKLRVPYKGKLVPVKRHDLFMDNYDFYRKFRRVLGSIDPEERIVYQMTLDADVESWSVYSSSSTQIGSSLLIVLVTALFGFVAANFRQLDGLGSQMLVSFYAMLLIFLLIHYFSLRHASHVKGKAKMLSVILRELERDLTSSEGVEVSPIVAYPIATRVP
jgi:hypothetical protein